MVVIESVGRNANYLDVASGKVRAAASDLAELGGADRGEISRVGEKDDLRTNEMETEATGKTVPMSHRSTHGSRSDQL